MSIVRTLRLFLSVSRPASESVVECLSTDTPLGHALGVQALDLAHDQPGGIRQPCRRLRRPRDIGTLCGCGGTAGRTVQPGGRTHTLHTRRLRWTRRRMSPPSRPPGIVALHPIRLLTNRGAPTPHHQHSEQRIHAHPATTTNTTARIRRSPQTRASRPPARPQRRGSPWGQRRESGAYADVLAAPGLGQRPVLRGAEDFRWTTSRSPVALSRGRCCPARWSRVSRGVLAWTAGLALRVDRATSPPLPDIGPPFGSPMGSLSVLYGRFPHDVCAAAGTPSSRMSVSTCFGSSARSCFGSTDWLGGACIGVIRASAAR